jgi:hypothetical protein
VVNNPSGPYARLKDVENNKGTLAQLADMRSRSPSLRLAYVDASSPGREIPGKGGVGWARKIGLDWGLSVLADSARESSPLISLDADTRVGKDYLSEIRSFFEKEERWAAIVDYAHPLDGPEKEAIVSYEMFLRYHELGLAYAGSPYAFPSIGSTIVCTARAYATVLGMNRRQAGEDFYFLQKLAKTGPVQRISSTTVFPSARSSHRVPFGTGRSVMRFLNGEKESAVYNPECYRVLKQWLHFAPINLDRTPEEVFEKASEMVHPELAVFLKTSHFEEAWENLQSNARTTKTLRAHFHGWFDGFRTLKLIHHLRDNGFPSIDTVAAVETLLGWMEIDRPISETEGDGEFERRRELLHLLRRICRDRSRAIDSGR